MHSSVRFVYAVLAVVMASVATAWAASVPPPAMHAKDAARALATRALLSLPASVVPPAVDASADGIQINVTRHVDCTYKSRTGDAVFVNYNVTLANGTKVDSMLPDEFDYVTIGNGEFIKGFELGIVDMCIGERRTLTIPPEFGFGAQGNAVIPPNTTIVVYLELTGIVGVQLPPSAQPPVSPAPST